VSREQGPVQLECAGHLTVRTIESLHARVREALEQQDVVTLDCTGANEIDLSFVQLLLSAYRSAGTRIALMQPLPEVLSNALRRAGLLTANGVDHPLWTQIQPQPVGAAP
jgi:two-component system chemotaxis sensor kinase CheA